MLDATAMMMAIAKNKIIPIVIAFMLLPPTKLSWTNDATCRPARGTRLKVLRDSTLSKVVDDRNRQRAEYRFTTRCIALKRVATREYQKAKAAEKGSLRG